MVSHIASALIIGATGVVGTRTARLLRQLYPELHITVGGRNMDKAEELAGSLGNAVAVKIDLERSDLGLSSGNFSVMALHVKDLQFNALRFAQKYRIPYVTISSAAFEVMPEVALFAQRPDRMPLVMASHWLVGAVTLPALYFARDFSSLDSILVNAVIDEQDIGGPAVYGDYERINSALSTTLVLEDGNWRWIPSDKDDGSFASVDGVMMACHPYSALDPMSLAAATDARSIRMNLATGESSSRRKGEPPSTEIIITLAGTSRDGNAMQTRHEIVHPEGQVPVTALGVALLMERLAGLKGVPPAAGLYMPNTLLEPDYMVDRMREFGASIRQVA